MTGSHPRSARDVVEELFRRQRAADDAVLDDLVAIDMVNHAAGPQPHAAAGPEVELPAMTRGRLATVVSRTGALPQAPTRTPAQSSDPIRLVIGANQAQLWGILAARATGWDVTGHGRLLRADWADATVHQLP
jgi:hypothetical protein